MQHAELDAAHDEGDGGQVAQFRLKRQDAANKRFQAATKTLAVTRRRLGVMKIEIRHENAAVADSAVGQCKSVDARANDRVSAEPAVAGTLREFFDAGLEDDRRAMAGQD